jgi:hypothetical protein
MRVALEKGVTALSDRPFHVDGDLAISFGRITTVRAANIRWLNPAWSKQPDMLSAKESVALHRPLESFSRPDRDQHGAG